MRKNVIALSVAAFVGGLGIATSASAAVLPDNAAVVPGTSIGPTDAAFSRISIGGTGHQLFLPYYNVQNGNATLLNLVNSDVVNGKAVKLRFRGGSNSDDVFDFQVYLSPGDVWTASLTKGANGITTLTTTDKSCTLPANTGKDGGGANSTFVTARLPNLVGDALATETREGYVEIFNMADIPPQAINADGSPNPAQANALFTAIKHVNGVPPCTQARMDTLQTDLVSLADARTRGLRAPTTGLFANWVIVNVPKAGTATGEFTSITAVRQVATGLGAVEVPARGNIVFFPQVGGNVANPDNFTADPSLRTIEGPANGQVTRIGAQALPVITAQFFDLPDISTPYLLMCTGGPTLQDGTCPVGQTPRGPGPSDPVNYITILQAPLATLSVSNEFLTDTSINAFTDWTFSSPTRRYNIAADYRPFNAGGTVGRVVMNGNLFYTAANTSINSTPGKRFQICTSTAGVTFFDREEGTAQGTQFVISPNPPAPAFRLCGETSVLVFNPGSSASVLGAEIARTNLTTTGASGTVIRDGWAIVSTPGPNNIGLPIVGKSYISASTGTLNVGGSWEHRYRPFLP